MYRKCEEREVCMYNIYGTNQYARISTTKWFSRPNGFHDYRTLECTGKYYQKKNIFKKRAIRVA